MDKVIDFTGKYKGKEGERVVVGNIAYAETSDLSGYDKIVAYESQKEILKDEKNVTAVKDPADKDEKKEG